MLGFHRRKFGFNITYRRGQSFQSVLKACAARTPVQANISATKRQAHCGGANRRFEFHKRGQLFIGVHNETLFVVTMRVSNPGS
jgi:hypothetical protein